jgi:hypothetical protein
MQLAEEHFAGTIVSIFSVGEKPKREASRNKILSMTMKCVENGLYCPEHKHQSCISFHDATEKICMLLARFLSDVSFNKFPHEIVRGSLKFNYLALEVRLKMITLYVLFPKIS